MRSVRRQRMWGSPVICLAANCALLLTVQFLFPTAVGAEEPQGAFPGVNGKIAFATDRDGNYEIYVMDADGSHVTRLTNNSATDLHPGWSADGTKIVFESLRDGNGEIYVMNADGTGQTRLTNNSADEGRPAWSPNGAKIVFTSVRDDPDGELYVMNADGSGQTRLTNSAGMDDWSAWSPDGTKIAFSSSRDADGEIYVMNADGTGQTRLTSVAGTDMNVNWSPDGSKIAFESDRSGDREIYVMNADGSGQTNVTNSPGFDSDPAWSPDGTKITFVSMRSGGIHEIYVMNADGSSQTNLTNNAAYDVRPDWQPISAGPCTLSCSATVPSTGQVAVAVQFTGGANASGTGCGPISFYWEFGDGQTSTEQSPAHAYASPGKYDWKLTVSASGANPCTQSGAITINPGGTCSITCSATVPSSGQAGVAVPFVGSAQLSVGCSQTITYEWKFGDGGTSTEQNPAHVYLNTGMYSWSLTASAPGATPCTSGGTINIVKPGSCVVSLTAKVPATGTVGKGVKFSGSGKASGNCTSRTVSYKWSFGDRKTSTAKRTTHTYTKAGTYKWSLTAKASKASATKTGTIRITGGGAACSLTVLATVPSSGVVNQPVSFSAKATKSGDCEQNTQYSWKFGDGGSSTDSAPKHTYKVIGIYHWELKVTNGSTVVNREGEIQINQSDQL